MCVSGCCLLLKLLEKPNKKDELELELVTSATKMEKIIVLKLWLKKLFAVVIGI